MNTENALSFLVSQASRERHFGGRNSAVQRSFGYGSVPQETRRPLSATVWIKSNGQTAKAAISLAGLPPWDQGLRVGLVNEWSKGHPNELHLHFSLDAKN